DEERRIRGQETGDRERGTGEARAEKALIKKNEKSSVAAEIVQPQVVAETEDKLHEERDEMVKNTACKQLINRLRRDPQYAGWTQEQFQEYAQFVWDTEASESRDEDTASAAPLAASQPSGSHPRSLPR